MQNSTISAPVFFNKDKAAPSQQAPAPAPAAPQAS
jgi:hypothetical protein